VTSNNNVNKVKAGGCGAIEAVVAALRAHPSSAAVQENGCTALRNLAANDANKVKAGGCGAIEAVVAALRAHPSSAAVQENGCTALRSICWTSGDLRQRARKAGAVGALTAGLSRFPTGSVATSAREALAKIQEEAKAGR
jgi:hypothetical protein